MNLREQYETETGYSAIAEYESDLNFSSRYVAWLEAKVEALQAALEKLTMAADAFAADQSRATDSRCGLVQPVSVRECEVLNDALKIANAILGADNEN